MELVLSTQEQQALGGPLDSFIKALIQWPDFAKVDRAMLKSGISTSLTAFKPATNTIGQWLIDAAINAATSLVDGWKMTNDDGRLVLGAGEGEIITMGASGEIIDYERIPSFEGRRTKKEVEDMIRSEGGDPKGFAPWVLFVLQFLPTAIELIRKLLGK